MEKLLSCPMVAPAPAPAPLNRSCLSMNQSSSRANDKAWCRFRRCEVQPQFQMQCVIRHRVDLILPSTGKASSFKQPNAPQGNATQRIAYRLPLLVAFKALPAKASDHVLGAHQIYSLKDTDNDMGEMRPSSQSARRGDPVLAWNPHSGPIFTNHSSSVMARRIAAGSGTPRSQFMSSDPPASTNQAYHERLRQHQPAELPLDAFGTLRCRFAKAYF
jgi:hypothetical protein